MKLPPGLLNSKGAGAKGTVKLISANSADKGSGLQEFSHQVDGTTSTCYILTAPGDVIEVDFAFTTHTADFVDLIIDGVRRKTHVCKETKGDIRGTLNRGLFSSREKNGKRGGLKSCRFQIKSQDNSEDYIMNNEVPSSVGSIILQIFQKKATQEDDDSHGNSTAAERYPDFEQCATWRETPNHEVFATGLIPSLEIDLIEPGKGAKNIKEQTQRLYPPEYKLLATLIFLLRTSDELRKLGIDDVPDYAAPSQLPPAPLPSVKKQKATAKGKKVDSEPDEAAVSEPEDDESMGAPSDAPPKSAMPRPQKTASTKKIKSVKEKGKQVDSKRIKDKVEDDVDDDVDDDEEQIAIEPKNTSNPIREEKEEDEREEEPAASHDSFSDEHVDNLLAEIKRDHRASISSASGKAFASSERTGDGHGDTHLPDLDGDDSMHITGGREVEYAIFLDSDEHEEDTTKLIPPSGSTPEKLSKPKSVSGSPHAPATYASMIRQANGCTDDDDVNEDIRQEEDAFHRNLLANCSADSDAGFLKSGTEYGEPLLPAQPTSFLVTEHDGLPDLPQPGYHTSQLQRHTSNISTTSTELAPLEDVLAGVKNSHQRGRAPNAVFYSSAPDVEVFQSLNSNAESQELGSINQFTAINKRIQGYNTPSTQSSLLLSDREPVEKSFYSIDRPACKETSPTPSGAFPVKAEKTPSLPELFHTPKEPSKIVTFSASPELIPKPTKAVKGSASATSASSKRKSLPDAKLSTEKPSEKRKSATALDKPAKKRKTSQTDITTSSIASLPQSPSVASREKIRKDLEAAQQRVAAAEQHRKDLIERRDALLEAKKETEEVAEAVARAREIEKENKKLEAQIAAMFGP